MAASSSDSAGPIVTSSSIKVIAEAVGISNLKDEVAEALAPDVEYRLRDLVQGVVTKRDGCWVNARTRICAQ